MQVKWCFYPVNMTYVTLCQNQLTLTAFNKKSALEPIKASYRTHLKRSLKYLHLVTYVLLFKARRLSYHFLLTTLLQ